MVIRKWNDNWHVEWLSTCTYYIFIIFLYIPVEYVLSSVKAKLWYDYFIVLLG